jgi:hypothetical protein
MMQNVKIEINKNIQQKHTTKMVFIYVLRLQQGKYYIGKTNHPKFRLENHFHSNGSEWTKLYRPIKVIELIPNCDDYDEDKYTRKYMDKYGMNNVRGGSFVSVKLEKQTIDALRQMERGTKDKCFTCGKEGHFANNCEENECWETEGEEEEEESEEEEEEEVWACDYCEKEFTEEKKCYYHEKYCNSKKKAFYVNEPYDCSKSESESDYIINKTTFSSENSCFRCGRKGHYAPSCYASKHIHGYYLSR